MSKRMYLVALTRKKVLVEAASQEAAIRAATKSMVKSVTLPTALEVARMMRANEAEIISETLAPIEQKQEQEDGEGVGRLGLGQPAENEQQRTDGDDSGGQQSEPAC